LADFVLAAMILISNRCNVNPDNLATPIAASIGDLITVVLLSFSTLLLHTHLCGNFLCIFWFVLFVYSILWSFLATHLWVTYVMLSCFFLLVPVWTVLILRNRFARPVLKSGWVPILSAAFISG
jgi:solute carrier family 41